jgi:hypothetical protein
VSPPRLVGMSAAGYFDLAEGLESEPDIEGCKLDALPFQLLIKTRPPPTRC